jgi:hypothetical protein
MLELFDRGMHRHRRSTYPFTTLPRKGMPRITFSEPCTRWMKDNNFIKVNYLYDKEGSLIAFEKTEVGYCLHITGSQSYVSAQSFLEYIGHPPAGRYFTTWDEEHKRLVVDLKV